MIKKHISLILFFTAVTILSGYGSVRAEGTDGEDNVFNEIISEIRRGSLWGEAGIYYERVNYDKDRFVEDGEITELGDDDLIVPYFQINYLTPEYSGFSFGAGLTGYDHINGGLDRSRDSDESDHFVFHEVYLKYNISETDIKAGRHEMEDSLFLSDYYEAISLSSGEFENLSLFFAVISEVAESDISKFVEFQNINRGGGSIDDFLYAGEVKWDVLPGALSSTMYYYHQGNLYGLYGIHAEIVHEMEETTVGLKGDVYGTDEDNRNGLRDENGDVKNSHIFNINPYFVVNDVVLGAGYIKADRDVGGREGGLIDDYFNPFNEGDKVYEPDAETGYGFISYETEQFNAGLVYGKTDYRDEGVRREEREFDIKGGMKFFENFLLEAEFAYVESESHEGDFNLLEVLVKYEF